MASCSNLVAKMKKRVTIQTRARTPDGQGWYTETWADGDAVYASIEPASGYQKFQAMQAQTPITHAIVMRYRRDVTTDTRLSYAGRVFEVQEALNHKEDGRFLAVKAVETEFIPVESAVGALILRSGGYFTLRPETTTPKLGKLTIPVNEIYAQPKASQKLIDDAAVDIEAWLARKVAEVFARKENTAFMVGTGVNQPRGILTYAAGTTVASQQIEQVVTGSAAALTYDGLVNLQAALKEEYQANASFLVNRLGFGSLMLIKDGNGTPIFNMAYDQRIGGARASVLGAPLYFASDMATVAANALAAVYGDFKRAYQIVDRTGIRVLRDPFTDKPFVKFYTTKRVGGGAVNFEAVKILKVAAA